MGLAEETVEFFSAAAWWPEIARLTYLQKIAALGLLALHGVAVAPSLPIEGSYVARSLDGRPIPADLRLPAAGGDFRLFRLEQGVLRLSSDGRFTLYFRYYHQLVRRGARPTSTPVLSDSESGTYKVEMGRMILTPAKKKGAKARPAIPATIAGQEIIASYVLQSGGTKQRITLTLKRDASFW
jgi:hypothetical protein